MPHRAEGGRSFRQALESAKVHRYVSRRRVAIARILRKHLPHYALKFRRYSWVALAERGRNFLQDGGNRARSAVAAKSPSARDHFVHDGPKRKDVCAGVHLPAIPL